MGLCMSDRTVKMFVKEIKENSINDELLFANIRFVESFMESTKETKMQLESKSENVYNYVKNCEKCTFVFIIREDEKKKITSLLRINETPKSFNFNLYVDENNNILSFNALFSTMMPYDTVTALKSGNASKPNLQTMDNNINMNNNMNMGTNNMNSGAGMQFGNNLNFQDDDLDLSLKKPQGQQEPEKEQPFYKKYFWYIVIGG